MSKLFPLLAAVLGALALLAPAATPVQAKEAPAYVALGDSLAFGVGASDPATLGYVGLTHDALARSDRYAARGLELLNLGVPGATSADLLLPGGQLDRAVDEVKERLDDDTSADDNVEIITVNIGGNDILGLGGEDSPCLDDPLSEGCVALYEEMLGRLEGNLGEVLKQLREAAPKADIIVLDMYSPLSGRGGPADLIAGFALEGLNAATERVVSKSDVDAKMARVYPLFRGHAQELVAADNLHPNDDGHALMSEVVLAAIEGRAPELPEELGSPVAVEELTQSPQGPQGEGGLLPVAREGDDEASVPLLLAIAIPASLLGLAAVAGVYLAARGRYPR
jgi:acyl-CoA thioesterase-1